MKIGEVSDDALNRFIAQTFEPDALPEFISARNASNATAFLDRKCYVAVNVGPDGFTGRYKYQPVPLDFVNTGDGLKMLLERLVADRVELRMIWCSNERFPSMLALYAERGRNTIHSTVVTDVSKMGRAVAEVFALANGWKE